MFYDFTIWLWQASSKQQVIDYAMLPSFELNSSAIPKIIGNFKLDIIRQRITRFGQIKIDNKYIKHKADQPDTI